MSPEEVGHPGTFCLLLYEYCELVHTTLSHCVFKEISDAASQFWIPLNQCF